MKSFSWRAFISLGLFVSFLMLIVSGIILYLAPPGRVANWTDWHLLGLSKQAWQNQHTIFSFSFALLSIFHLFSINWKAFWSYIAAKSHAGLGKPVEIFSILLIAMFFGIGTFLQIPPFSTVIDFGRSFSESWEEQQSRAPVPHTERMTLKEISERFASGESPESLRGKLEKEGISVTSLDQTLENIASENSTSAQKVYELLDIAPAPRNTGRGNGEGRNRQ